MTDKPIDIEAAGRTAAVEYRQFDPGDPGAWTLVVDGEPVDKNTAIRSTDVDAARAWGHEALGTYERWGKMPSRVVTADNEGWYNTPDGYRCGYIEPTMSLAELEQTRGPLRPVLPITDEDEALLRETFARAGRRTVTTIAAALEEVFHQLREQQGGLSNPSGSYDYAKRTLTAGRAGSWESAVLIEVVLFGNGLNLAPERRGEDHSIEALRKRGPSGRVDVDARDTLVEVFTRWVTGPDRYTEVAETLAAVVSQYADDTAGADGWRAVADQWLQPGALAREDFSICYRLLYSLSEHFNPDLL